MDQSLQTPRGNQAGQYMYGMSSPDEELWYAAKYGDEDNVKSALKKGANVNYSYINGFSPIHQACHRNHTGVVRQLLDNNADINAQTKDGLTALHQACYNGNLVIAGILVSEGADLNIQDKNGNTPLHDAVRHNKEPLYMLLLSHGADSNIANKKSQLPVDLSMNPSVKMKISHFMKYLDIPEEIRRMDGAAVQSFIHALEVGVYHSYHVRLMVVGHYGVGKSTLTLGLLGNDTSVMALDSTNGIEVFIGRCHFNKLTHEWTQKNETEENHDDLHPEVSTRIFRLIKNKTQERAKTAHASSSVSGVPRNKLGLSLQLPLRSLSLSSGSPSPTPSPNVATSGGCDEVDGLMPSDPKTPTPVKEKNLLKKFIDVRDKKTSPQSRENDVIVDFWDFGGQAIFYTTHQAFFSPRCIYLLVFDLTKDLDEDVDDEDLDPGERTKSSVITFMQFWMSSIKTYSKGHKAGFPTILLIGTHLDEIPESERDERVLRAYLRIHRTFPDEIASGQLIVDKRLFMNARNVFHSSFHHLRHLIIQKAKTQPNWGEELPMKWLPIQDAIQKLKKEKVKILNIKDIQRINASEHKVKLSDEELDVFLRFLHSIGHVLYFPDPHLREYVILEPVWLIYALRSFVTTESFCSTDFIKREAWTNMSQTGIIPDDVREALWSTEEHQMLKQHETHLLKVMEKLDIIARPKSYHNGCAVDLPFYYVPCMVKDVNAAAVKKIKKSFRNALTVKFTFKSNFLPAAVFNKLIAICLSMWPVKNKQLFSGCCVFSLDVFHSMLLLKKEHMILLSIVHKRNESDTSLLLCRNIHGFIEESLDKIAVTYAHHNSDQASKMYKIDLPWEQEDPMPQTPPTMEVACLKGCNGLAEASLREMPTEMELGRLATYLGKDDFITVATELSVDMERQLQIEADHPESITKRIFYALHNWRKCSSDIKPDFKSLRQALLNMDMDEHILCKIYKTQKIEKKVTSNICKTLLNDIPTEEMLDQIASSVGREYFLLGIELGIPCSSIERLCQQNMKNCLKLNREMFQFWKVNSITRPTIRALAIAIANVQSDFWRFCEIVNGEEEDDDY